MIALSSSAEHLQSQHPCERGAARVKQHFCPVGLHLPQHYLIGLPFIGRKLPSCKESAEKQKAHLGGCHQRKQLDLLQTGESAITPHQSCIETLLDLQQDQVPKTDKKCPEKKRQLQISQQRGYLNQTT